MRAGREDRLNHSFLTEPKAVICIASPHSGCGKTMISCALIRALKDRGLTVQSFKAGPDYIDPLFHDTILADGNTKIYDYDSFRRIRKCVNLDTYFSDHNEIRRIFDENALGADVSVVEGVMGLFDGLAGVERAGSTYDLACCLRTPVIMVFDAKGASRSLIAMIRGFLDYDEEGLIRGVILNRCSKAMYDKLAPVIGEELGIRAYGYLPVLKDVSIESRYLGLTLPEEIVDIKLKLAKLALYMKESIDIDGIIEAGRCLR